MLTPAARAPAPRGPARRDPVLLALAGLTVLAAAWFLLDLASRQTQVAVFWWLQPPTDLGYVILSWRVARLPGLTAAARRFWFSMVVAGSFFAVGDTVQATLASVRPNTVSAEPGPFQGSCLIVGMLFPLAVLLTYPTGLGSRQERTRFWLDAGTVLAAAGVFGWYFSAGSADDPQALVGVLLVCGLSLVLVFAVVKLVLGSAGPITKNAAIVGAAATAIQGANTVTPAMLDSPHLDILLIARLVPSVLIVVGIRIHEREVATDPSVLTRRRTRPYSRMPYLAVAATHALLVGILADGLDMRVWGVVAGVILITGLVVVRQLAAFTDNARLLSRLDASLLEIRMREQRFRSLVQHASEINAIMSADGTVSYVSPGVERILGLRPEQVVGMPDPIEIHPDDEPRVRGLLAELTPTPGATVTYQLRAKHANGSWRWLEVITTNLLEDPSVQGIVSNCRDVTEARRFQDQLQYQASHDPLTRLANRTLFHERLAAAVRARRRNDELAILLIDLDDFKGVNDSLGHHAGDALLVTVAERLRSCVRPSDTVARLGGDEFAVLLLGIAELDITVVIERIMAAFAEPVPVAGHDLRIQASVGVASGMPEEPEILLRNADAAMYTAKRSGKGTYAYYQPAPV
jgi:diguanylate cyclase (GGDEF)-like protein/PAS domain S-box-containing protein